MRRAFFGTGFSRIISIKKGLAKAKPFLRVGTGNEIEHLLSIIAKIIKAA